MLLKREGFPEEEELVLCTVTRIHFHSVFVQLDEYGRTGLIHISEVSPGRIRNIRDFVVEGKKIVCKILRVNKEKGHIDLSLRRVNENQKRTKISEIKQEQLAEKIVEYVAKSLNMEHKGLYEELTNKIFKKYDSLYPCFGDIANNKDVLAELAVPEKIAKLLTESIKQRIKKEEVHVGGELKLTSYKPDGVEIVKDALKKAEDIGKESTTISYKGAGKYKVSVKSSNYKDAEKILEKLANAAINYVEKQGGEGKFARQEA